MFQATGSCQSCSSTSKTAGKGPWRTVLLTCASGNGGGYKYKLQPIHRRWTTGSVEARWPIRALSLPKWAIHRGLLQLCKAPALSAEAVGDEPELEMVEAGGHQTRRSHKECATRARISVGLQEAARHTVVCGRTDPRSTYLRYLSQGPPWGKAFSTNCPGSRRMRLLIPSFTSQRQS